MKKAILLIGCLSLLTVGIISVSCSKDDEWKGCSCSYYYNGEKETETVTVADIKEAGLESYIKSCAELEDFAYEYEEFFGDFENLRCVDL
ncbi:MAG: hypothetical protein LBF04_03025 [Prevotellaceae bacterium]|jgi:hypothetical protein|nr:hypothetical protein [Prevotellaceae bacterium]